MVSAGGCFLRAARRCARGRRASAELSLRSGADHRRGRSGLEPRCAASYRRRAPVAALGPAGRRHQPAGRGGVDRDPRGRGDAAGWPLALHGAGVELHRAAGASDRLPGRRGARLCAGRLCRRAPDGDRRERGARRQHAAGARRAREAAQGRAERRGGQSRQHPASHRRVVPHCRRDRRDAGALSRRRRRRSPTCWAAACT